MNDSIANLLLHMGNLRDRALLNLEEANKHAFPDQQGAQYWKGAADVLSELERSWKTKEPSRWGT